MEEYAGSYKLVQKYQRKTSKYFIKFDIVDFYSSITKEILLNALKFASNFTAVHRNDKEIIMHSCKTVLKSNGQTWVKKHNDNLFDIPMGAFHRAEVCELVGLYLLNSIRNIIKQNDVGIYRDDGLIVIPRMPNRKLETLRKKLQGLFRKEGFTITVQIGITKTEFLDTYLDLECETYQPYKKPNSAILYINKNSNHPDHIKKEIPRMLSKRLSTLSSSETIFKASCPAYQEALKSSNYNDKLLEYNNNLKSNKKTDQEKT